VCRVISPGHRILHCERTRVSNSACGLHTMRIEGVASVRRFKQRMPARRSSFFAHDRSDLDQPIYGDAGDATQIRYRKLRHL